MRFRRQTASADNPERRTWWLFVMVVCCILLAGAILWVRVSDSAANQEWCQRMTTYVALGAKDRAHTDELFTAVEQVQEQVAKQYPNSALSRETLAAFQKYFAERAKDDEQRAANPIPNRC